MGMSDHNPHAPALANRVRPSSVFALQRRRQPRTLVDRALGVELGGDIGAADDVDVCAAGTQRLGELAQRFLRSEEHTSELQSLMRISYAVFCLKKKTHHKITYHECATQQHHNNTAY